MKFRQKMLISFLVVTLLVVFIEILRSFNARGVANSFDVVVNEIVPELNALERMASAEADMMEAALTFSLARQFNPDSVPLSDEFEAASTELYINLEIFVSSVTLSESEAGVITEDLRTSADRVYEVGSRLISVSTENPESDEIPQLLEELETASLDFDTLIAVAITHELQELREDGEAGVQSAYTRIFTGVMSTLLVLAVLLVDYLGFRRTILKPIDQLEAIARKIAGGDYSARVPEDRQDELGMLARSFNAMAEAVDKRETELHELNEVLEVLVVEAVAAREEAEKSDQVKSAFLASMSHELRTPLNSIINFSKFVAKGVMGPVNERQVETLGKVVDSGQHLLKLINDVLDMSKIESGSLNLFVEEDVDLTELLQSALNHAEALIGQKPIAARLNIESELPRLTVDRQRVLQVLLNIVSNATKFTERGSIVISAYQSGDEVHISVKDSGPGIPPDDQQLVFEPFKQTQTGLRQGSGTGLGMPISRSLVEAHGGRLWLESELGEGTTFYLTLPVQKLQPTLEPA